MSVAVEVAGNALKGFDDLRCRICNSSSTLAFTHKVLNKYDCDFYFCAKCGGLQSEEPYWLDEAYSSPVAAADTGVLWRNLYLARVTSVVLYFLFDRRGRFLDAAGGYGIFTRLMRDAGFDYYWTDKYCSNLTARGFESDAVPTEPYTAVTAFEVMEHLPDPVGFVAELLENTGTDTIIFTTELFAGEPPAPDEWWYYAFPTGQHITFFQRSTLELIGNRFGLRFYSSGMLHVWTRAKLNPLAFRLLTSPSAVSLLNGLPRRALGSRTMADHERLIQTSGE
ncbi:class I SAM-dependent methyltransferase [Mycobacterium tilburgii]|uniref:class I SAM-dependent methyltransferase n=1 Tax=Mycobacterium tilburgii TaxID=44467 RepID=UPI0016428BC2|nr:class I SAM-dependent methyltransferase [Mycobacterium tilburgii]